MGVAQRRSPRRGAELSPIACARSTTSTHEDPRGLARANSTMASTRMFPLPSAMPDSPAVHSFAAPAVNAPIARSSCVPRAPRRGRATTKPPKKREPIPSQPRCARSGRRERANRPTKNADVIRATRDTHQANAWRMPARRMRNWGGNKRGTWRPPPCTGGRAATRSALTFALRDVR